MKKVSLLLIILTLFSCKITTPKSSQFPYIVIMFDDGRESVFANALPIMNRYNIVGTNAIVTKNIGNGYAQTWEQVCLLDSVYHWEIASHTYSHPHLNQLSDEEFRYQMQKPISDIKAYNISVETLAIPYGEMQDYQYQIATEYYKNIRSSHNNHEKLPINRKFLSCYTIHKNTPVTDIYDRIYYAIQNNEPLLIMLFHDVSDTNEEYTYSTEKFEKVMKFIKKNNLKTVTLKEAMNELCGN